MRRRRFERLHHLVGSPLGLCESLVAFNGVIRGFEGTWTSDKETRGEWVIQCWRETQQNTARIARIVCAALTYEFIKRSVSEAAVDNQE